MKKDELRVLIQECINEMFIEREHDAHERSGEALKIASSLWKDVYNVEFADRDNTGIKYRVFVGGPRNLVGFIKQGNDGKWLAFNHTNSSWAPIEQILKEMSTSAGAGGYLTKFAFSRRSEGNPDAAETLGYKIVGKKKNKNNYAH